MRLLESGEMYLETIHILSLKGGHVRSLDVAEYMGFSKPSVSRAVGLLKGGGYITVDEDGYLTLTDVGREVASKIYERHTVLTDFLSSLGFPDACEKAGLGIVLFDGDGRLGRSCVGDFLFFSHFHTSSRLTWSLRASCASCRMGSTCSAPNGRKYFSCS